MSPIPFSFCLLWIVIHRRSSKDDPPAVDKEFIKAARGIARCVDLWCDVEKVINIAKLIAQDEASKAGELEEAKTLKEARDNRLKE